MCNSSHSSFDSNSGFMNDLYLREADRMSTAAADSCGRIVGRWGGFTSVSETLPLMLRSSSALGFDGTRVSSDLETSAVSETL